MTGRAGAVSGAMSRGGKTCWKAIQVHGPGGPDDRDLRELHAAERLVALYRFQSGEVSSDHCFTSFAVTPDGRREAEVTDPGEIDWTTFPVVAALEAVTHDELRRLRSLLHADGFALSSPTPPLGLTWGLELGRRATSSEA